MRKLITIFFFAFLLNTQAQDGCEPYGGMIFNFIVQGNNVDLKAEFVDLIEYQSYVDRLPMDQDKKEIMKEHALENYMSLKKSFLNESEKIVAVYRQYSKDEIIFKYQYCTFLANPKYPGIGFIEVFYLAEDQSEVIDDSVSFECIYTSAGWKIIDGFYQGTP